MMGGWYLMPGAVEIDVPSWLSVQSSNGHPSTMCGSRWPGLSPGHDGNRESRSTAVGIIIESVRDRPKNPARIPVAPSLRWHRRTGHGPDTGTVAITGQL